MQSISRIALSALIALATCFGAFALAGCGNTTSTQAESASAQSADAAASAASADTASADAAASDAAASGDAADDEDQDNCYGDDLPARNS